MQRTILRLAVPTVAALAVAACGSGGGSDNASASGSGTSAASSAGSAATSTSPSESASESGSASAAASADTTDPKAFAAKLSEGGKSMKTYHMVIDGGAAGQSMKGSGDIDMSTGTPQMAMTMTAGAQKIDMRLVDGAMYMSMPGQTPAGKFVKMTSAQMKAKGLGSLTDQFDVTATQKQSLDAVRSVTDGGVEDVAGEKLHKYTVVSDGTKVREATRQQLVKQKAPKDAIDSALKQIPDQLPSTIWVDDQFRTHKQVLTMGPTKVTTTLSKINEPVKIEAPAASQVVSAP